MKIFLAFVLAAIAAVVEVKAQTVYSVRAVAGPESAPTNQPDWNAQYKLGADSMPQEGVPRGELIQMPPFTNLMVFQDGGSYSRSNGEYRVPVVFDNLIAKKEMPVTIGVFINPGNVPAAEAAQRGRSNRSFEYDSLGDLYSKFLINELLPEVTKKYNITKDPEGRAIGGASSGGICAFTVAWERPDEFRKVLSHIGSFTNIRGGHNYAAMIRKTERKPLRVFLQDGSHDLDNLHGNWPLANQEMAASLKFKNYDHQFVFGEGTHSGKHGGAILPDSLRWLWRDYAK
jgi:enterochelin esterase-like enzyme